jgi:hypothetical protein
MKRILVFLSISAFFIFVSCANAKGLVLGKQIEVMPQGEYATIKTEKGISAIHKLGSSNKVEVQQCMKKVLSHPGDYAPPVLCAASSVLVKQHKMKQASFWYFACLLRAISDAEKTKDRSSREAIPTLVSDFFKPIDDYIYDRDELREKIIFQVVKWDKKTPRTYDARWIMLYGLGAFSNKKFDFAPKSKWNAINAATREKFLKIWKADE